MNEGMSNNSIACFLMYPLSSGFYPNIHYLLVNDRSLAGGSRFSLQFDSITKDLGSFDPSASSYAIS